MMMYKKLNTVSAVLFMTLSVIAMFFPELFMMLFGIEGNASVFFVGRRTSILFLGLAMILWLGRYSNDVVTIRAVSIGMPVLCLLMAMLGLVEYLRGACGIGVMIPVVIELALGAAYLKLLSGLGKAL